MKSVRITCDRCEANLTSTGNCEDFRLLLSPEAIPSVGGFVTAMVMLPALDRDYHFCGWKCLVGWVLEKEKKPERGEVDHESL